MRTLYTKRFTLAVAFALIIIVLIASLAVASFCVEGQQGTTNVGQYTFDRQMDIDGETVYFYESGDTRYHYSHDSNGFILIREQDSLTYATNVGGVPVSSGVSYTASDFAINRVEKMTVEEIDFENNSYLYMDSIYNSDTSQNTSVDLSNLGSTNVNDDADKIYNVSIYIAFADDSISDINHLKNDNPLNDALNGNHGSVASYYSELTYGGLEVISIFPYEDTQKTITYVYQDSHNRSYYNVDKDDRQKRAERERELLTSAVDEVAQYFNFNGVDLDADNDGYVDSIGFFINGSDSNDWGNLLWPHSWSFSGFNNTSTKLGGVTCGTFMFNFCNDVQTSTIAHEFFHVLGAPDLYHYDCGTCMDIPVGYWDLMGSNFATPQYSLTHIRQKYLGYIEDTQVVEVKSSGIYQLDAVQTVDTNGVLAYKIPTDDPNQYIWVEYRSNELGGWEGEIDGSGLIVYRVDATAEEGNRHGGDNNPNAVNEVYIFRPDGDRLESIKRANLSPDNAYFTTLGQSKSKYSATYNHKNIYKSDGTNTGIVIEPTSRTASTIEFVIKLEGKDFVDDDYFVDSVNIDTAEYYSDEFAGVNVQLTLGEINVNYLSSIDINMYTAGGSKISTLSSNLAEFRTAYNSGQRQFDARFIVDDNDNTFESVFKGDILIDPAEPSYIEVCIKNADGDYGKVAYSAIDAKGFSWEYIKTAELQFGASVSTTNFATFATKKNGNVVSSMDKIDCSAYADIVAVSATENYVLLLNSLLQVTVISLDGVSRQDIENWSDIICIEAQSSVAYGLSKQGTVNMWGGSDDINSQELSNWSGIYKISASETHIVGITSGGTVMSIGDNYYGQCNTSSWSKIKAVVAGDTFTAGLKEDGTVVFAGSLTNGQSVADWDNIVALSASDNYLLGLTKGGRVLAVGSNDYNQCDTSSLIDIIAISASATYGAMVRTDGVVQYVGDAEYNPTIKTLSENLINDNYIQVTDVLIALNNDKTYYVRDELELNLGATVNPVNATYKRILYASSNTDVAIIDSNGNIDIVGVGSVTFTATANATGVYKEITINCEERIALQSIAFSDASRTVVVGETIQLSLIFTPTNATVTGQVVYSPTDNTYISIDEDGTITGKKELIGFVVEVTATLVENGITYTAKCEVSIKSNITGVEWNTKPTKTEYLYGEPLDLTGGLIDITSKIVFENTTTEKIDKSMVTGFNSKVLGTQTITITYVGYTLTYDVIVKDYILNIAIKDKGLIATEFDIGETFSLGNGKIVLNYASGASTILAEDVLNISHTDTLLNTLGTQTVTIDYTTEGKTYSLTYQITVVDKIASIDISGISKAYMYMQELDTTTSVTLNLISGGTSQVTLADCTVSGYDSSLLGFQTITVTYVDKNGNEFSKEIQVQVMFKGSVSVINKETGKDAVSSVVSYYTGDTLAIAVTINTNGTTVDIPLYDSSLEQTYYYKVSGISESAKFGETYIVHINLYLKNTNGSYSKQEPSTNISVCLDRKPVSITMAEENVNVYLNQTPTLPKLKLVYDNGDIAYGTASAVQVDTSVLGQQTAYARYMGVVYEYNITVLDYAVSLNSIADMIIEIGADLNLVVVANMASGATESLVSGEYVIANLDDTLLDKAQAITVSYTDGMGTVSATFNLTIYDKVVSISVTKAFKTAYLYGDSFVYDSSYTIVYGSGTEKVVDYDSTLFSFAFGSKVFDGSTTFNSTKVGTQSVFVMYIPAKMVLEAVAVTVSDYVVDITATLAETTYQYGQDISIEVQVAWASGAMQTVKDFTTNYKATQVGTQKINVTYGNKTVFAGEITVVDVVVRAEITGTGRTWFYYGEAFSYIGRELVLTHESGIVEKYKDTALESYLTNNYNATDVGTNKVIFKLDSNLNIAESCTFFYETMVEVKAQSNVPIIGIASGSSASLEQGIQSIVYDSVVTAGVVLSELITYDYLTLVLECGGQQLSSEDAVPSGAIIKAINGSGTVICKYYVFVLGDMNGDANVDKEDVKDMADTYLGGGDKYSYLLDLNGDGSFSLTDIVLWAEKTNLPQNVPTKEIALQFITFIRKES